MAANPGPPLGEPVWVTVQGRARGNALCCQWMCVCQNTAVLAQRPEELALSPGNMGTRIGRAGHDLEAWSGLLRTNRQAARP